MMNPHSRALLLSRAAIVAVVFNLAWTAAHATASPHPVAIVQADKS